MANQEHVELLKYDIRDWNQWREDNPNIIPDLEEANFGGMNLSEANLELALLGGANLKEASLHSANLRKANLRGANLKIADLISVDLTGVDLSNANLIGANLMYANLTEANITKAHLGIAKFIAAKLDQTNFNQALVFSTQFCDVDLSTAKALESVNHRGPSTIGLDTITLSQGKIPEIFLRGCGVSEDFITYIPSLISNPIEFYSCFISYAHADKVFARQLNDFLQGRGIRCWLDEHQLLPGHDIFEEIDRGIKLWDKVLLCASKDSLTSWWVDNEIDRAFKKEQTIMKSRGKKVLALIPLDLDGFIFDGWENGKAPQVKSRLTADFTGWQTDNDKLQKQFELVLKALRTDGGREAPPSSLL